MSLLHYRIMGSVVLLHDIANKTCFSQNKIDIIRTCGFYRIIYINLIARGKSTLDGYDIMANNQNLYAAYEWHFHFQNLTVELYVNHFTLVMWFLAGVESYRERVAPPLFTAMVQLFPSNGGS